MKRQSFIKGSLILIILGVFARSLGMLFRVPLDRLVGTEGLGIYFLLYPPYLVLLALSTTGLTAALSKRISEYRALEDEDGAWLMYQTASKLFLLLGFLASLCIFFSADFLISHMHWPPEARWGLIGLAPAPFFVAVQSSLRGLFQGHANMTPSGVSMVIEQIGRIVTGIGLAWFFMAYNGNVGMAVGGAAFGAAGGAFLGSVYLLWERYRLRGSLRPINQPQKRSGLMKHLLQIAIPISLSSMILSLTNAIDAFMLPDRLLIALGNSDTALDVIGGYSRANTLVGVPMLISLSLSAAIVPHISAAYALRDKKTTRRRVSMGLKMASLMVFPAAIGMALLSRPLILCFFTSDVGWQVLVPLSLSVIPIVFAQITGSMLNAIEKPLIPIYAMVAGALVKIGATSWLTVQPDINILGAAYSTILSYLVICVIQIAVLRRETDIGVTAVLEVVKPLLPTALMTISLIVLNRYFDGSSAYLHTASGVTTGGLLYILATLLFGVLPDDELKQVPGGAAILRLKNRHSA